METVSNAGPENGLITIQVKGPLFKSLDDSPITDGFSFYLVRELKSLNGVGATYQRQSNQDKNYFYKDPLPEWIDVIRVTVPLLAAGGVYIGKQVVDAVVEIVKKRLTAAVEEGSKIEQVTIYGPNGEILTTVKVDKNRPH